jgi:16S rRNA processing protein RimM
MLGPAGNEPGKRVIIGKISGVHGVRGWLKVFSYTDPRENIFLYQPWLLGEGKRNADATWTEVKFDEHGKIGKALVVKFPGVDDRETAVQLIDRPVAVQRERLPKPASGEYYWVDLLHMEVVSQTGRHLGRVADIRATGANDVLVVEGVKRCSIPFVMDEVIRQVDLDRAIITVDWEWD